MVKRLEASSGTQRLFALSAFVAVVAALYFAKEIVLPLGLAVLLSFVLTPMVVRMERIGLSRIPSVVVVVMISFAAIGGVAWMATDQVVQLSSRLPDYKNNLISRIRSARSGGGGKLDQAAEAIEEIGKELTKGESAPKSDDPSPEQDPQPSAVSNQDWFFWMDLDAAAPATVDKPDADEEESAVAVKVVQMPPSPLSQVKGWLGPLVAPLSTAGIVSVLAIFMLVMREDLRNRMIRLCGTSNIHVTTEAIDDAARRLSRYLRMQLLINTIYGVVVAAGLTAIGVPSPLLWGILGLMLRFLPYVGPWIAAVMPIMLSLAISENWTQPILTIGLFVLLELVVNNVLEPWLYGSSVGVSSFGVIVAAIFWTWLWGPVGLVLAMPLTVCMVVLGNKVPQLTFLSILLSDRSALAPPEHMYQLLLTAKDEEAFDLADKLIETDGLIAFYDQVFIPALRLAERDRHAGYLSDLQESLMAESALELVEDLRRHHPAADQNEHPRDPYPRGAETARVLCIPVEDRDDAIVASVLQELLAAEGRVVEVNASRLLASETVSKIGEKDYWLVVLVALPPLGTRKAKYLCRRLREHYRHLQIVAAVFGQDETDSSQQRLLESGANRVVHTLVDALAAVRTAGAATPSALPTANAGN